MTFFKVQIEAVGETREDAISYALKAIAGIVSFNGPDYLVGGTDGNAGVKISEEEH